MLIEYVTDGFVENAVQEEQSPLTEIGSFVYTRTYSRWKAIKGRREHWQETVQRAVNYNVTLAREDLRKKGLRQDYSALHKEAERIINSIYNTKQFPAYRTFWLGS